MKSIIIILLLICSFTFLHSQSIPKLELEANAFGNDRDLLTLSNISNDNSSSLRFLIKTGTLTNLVNGGISTFAKNYFPASGYNGITALTNDASGILFRAIGANGHIRFLTQGASIATNQKMILSDIGNLGIGVLAPASKIHVRGGDVFIADPTSGVIFKSSNTMCYRLNVDSNGNLITAQTTCPQ